MPPLYQKNEKIQLETCNSQSDQNVSENDDSYESSDSETLIVENN
jgi:hypothetical protein